MKGKYSIFFLLATLLVSCSPSTTDFVATEVRRVEIELQAELETAVVATVDAMNVSAAEAMPSSAQLIEETATSTITPEATIQPTTELRDLLVITDDVDDATWLYTFGYDMEVIDSDEGLDDDLYIYEALAIDTDAYINDLNSDEREMIIEWISTGGRAILFGTGGDDRITFRDFNFGGIAENYGCYLEIDDVEDNVGVFDSVVKLGARGYDSGSGNCIRLIFDEFVSDGSYQRLLTDATAPDQFLIGWRTYESGSILVINMCLDVIAGLFATA